MLPAAKHMISLIDADRCLYTKNYRGTGIPAIRFVDTTDKLTYVKGSVDVDGVGDGVTLGQPWTALWVGSADTLSVDRTPWTYSHTSGNALVLNQWLCVPATASRPRCLFRRHYNAGANADCQTRIGVMPEEFAVMMYVYTGTEQILYINGIECARLTSIENGASSLSIVTLGGNWTGVSKIGNFTGWVFAFATANSVLSTKDRQRTEKYYLNRFGMKWSPSTTLTLHFHQQGNSHSRRDPTNQTGFLDWPSKLRRMLDHPYNLVTNRAFEGKHLVGGTAPDITTMWANSKPGIGVNDIPGAGPECGNDARSDVLTPNDQTGANAHVSTVLGPAARALIDDQQATSGRAFSMDSSPLPSDQVTDNWRRDIVDQVNVIVRNHQLRYRHGAHAITWDTLRGGAGNAVSATYMRVGDTLHLNDDGTTVQANAAYAIWPVFTHTPLAHANLVLWISSGQQVVTLADNDPVASINSIVGTDGTAAATEQPLFKLAVANYAHRPSLLFDGINDNIDLDDYSITDWTAVLVADPTAYADLNPILGGSGQNGIYFDLAGRTSILVPSGGFSFTHPARQPGDIFVIRSDGRAWRNGVECTLESQFGAAPYTLTVGKVGINVAGNIFTGHFLDALIFNAAIPIVDINRVFAFMGASYRTTIANIAA